MRFDAGGSVVTQFSDNDPLKGTWILESGRLTLSFDIHGTHLDEAYDAVLAGDRLRLWSVDVGRIFARPGAPFTPKSTQTSETGPPTVSTVGGVRYSLSLPPNYRLVPDGSGGKRWESADAQGLYFEVATRKRAVAEPVGNTPKADPCPPPERPLWAGSSARGSHGVDKLVRIHTSLCVPSTRLNLRCSGEHHRGEILPGEKAAAEAVCQSLRLVD